MLLAGAVFAVDRNMKLMYNIVKIKYREETAVENIKWLFFDIGSTLINEEKAYEHRFRDIAETAGVPYETVYETAVNFYKQNKKGDHEAARFLGSPIPMWHKEDEEPYPEAAACLERLHVKYKTGIIANQSPGTKARLTEYGLIKYIDLVIASAEEGVCKPDRKIFELALERAGCKPCEAVMIGDRIDNDILPAKALGFHTILIKQGFNRLRNISGEAEQPEYTAHSLSGICDIL